MAAYKRHDERQAQPAVAPERESHGGEAGRRADGPFAPQTRLLITFLLLSLVPVLFIGIFAYNTHTGSINAKLGDSAEQNMELLDTILNTELERYASGTGETAAIGKRNMITDITDLLTDFIVQSDYLRNIRIAGRYGSYFVTTIPQSHIAGETMGITRSLVAVTIVLIALSFAATFIVYFSITQPTRTIVSRCNVVAGENLDRPQARPVFLWLSK